MYSLKHGLTIAVLLTFFFFPMCFSQGNNPITEKEKSDIIEKVNNLLHEHYIYPERVPTIAEHTNGKLISGYYANLVTLEEFLEALNNDMEREGKDHHLDVSFGPDRVKQIRLDQHNEQEQKKESYSEEWMQQMKYENFRLRKVERLDGNIGYFSFLNFVPLGLAKESIVGVMTFLRYSSAVIIDLRENGGGYGETMNFMLSYFLKDSAFIGENRHRKGNRIEKSYVPYDPMIIKYPEEVPVYILVSNKTSSAAEGFAVTLQQLKRAVIVGEQTKGEGNPGELFVVNDSLYIMIPTIESRNPNTGKGIDGIGVTPDIRIGAGQAFNRAMLEACATLSRMTPEKELKQLYQWQIPFWENELNPDPLTTTVINAIVGDYAEGRKILSENDTVYYSNQKGQRVRLDYLGKGVFQNAEKKWLRLVMPQTDRPIPDFEWVWDDGVREQVKRLIK